MYLLVVKKGIMGIYKHVGKLALYNYVYTFYIQLSIYKFQDVIKIPQIRK